jgi:hypothetical protein
MSRGAMCCVRGPNWRTGRILVQGSMASQRKTHVFGTAQPRAQFVQLEVREGEMEKEALVQSVRVSTCTSEKGW